MVENESIMTNEPAPLIPAGEKRSARPHNPGSRPRPAGRALPEIIAEQLRTLQLQHRAVLSTGSVEAIHRMRVSTRKLQASLDLLQVKSDHLKIAKLKSRLRNWRRVLSSVRNYDVFLKLISLETSPRKGGRGEQFASLVSILEQKRKERIAEVQAYLESANISKFAASLGVRIPPLPPSRSTVGDVGAPPVERATAGAEHMGSLIEIDPAYMKKWPDENKIALRTADRIDQRLAEFQALAARAHETTHPRELHQLRIAAKRLRYLLEVVSDQGYGDATRALVSLRAIQDRIGDWHDLEALEEEIIDRVSGRKFLKRNLTESAHMLLAAAHMEKKKSAFVKRLFPIKVARSIPMSAQKLARALRRSTLPPKARNEAALQEAGKTSNEPGTPSP